jgi:hypothetical protein
MGAEARALRPRQTFLSHFSLRGRNSARFPRICAIVQGIIGDAISEFESSCPAMQSVSTASQWAGLRQGDDGDGVPVVVAIAISSSFVNS